MKCPRCELDNPNVRSVCSGCGMFLYDGRTRNRVPLTAAQKRKQAFRVGRQMLGMMLKFSLVLLAMLILSLVVIILVQTWAG